MKYLRTYEKKFCKYPIIYFAHPVNTYGTDIEKKCISLIENKFRNCTIINPGEEYYQTSFKTYKEKNPRDYMNFFKELVETCSYIVYLPFIDMKIGAGVWFEVQQLYKIADNIYEINISDNQINKVTINHVNDNKLSVEETRIKIKEKFIIENSQIGDYVIVKTGHKKDLEVIVNANKYNL